MTMTTERKSLGECLIVDWSELPTRQEIDEAVKRLRKDADIIGQIRAKKETATPEMLRSVANFLESVSTRGAKTLK